MSDAIADLPGLDVIVSTPLGNQRGRVAHVVADHVADPSAIVLDLSEVDGGGRIIIPWHAILAVVTDKASP